MIYVYQNEENDRPDYKQESGSSAEHKIIKSHSQ